MNTLKCYTLANTYHAELEVIGLVEPSEEVMRGAQARPPLAPISPNMLGTMVVRSAEPLLFGMAYQLENVVGRREWSVVLKLDDVDSSFATLTWRFGRQFVEGQVMPSGMS